MPDKNVDQWKQEGRLYLWEYTQNTRNHPGWHLTADEDFIRKFAELVACMQVAQYNCQKSIGVTAPTGEILTVPNNHFGRATWQSPQILILKHRHEYPAGDDSSLQENAGTVTLSVGRQTLDLLKECLLELPEKNDYSVKIGNTRLWFW